MKSRDRCREPATRWAILVGCGCLAAVGCKSDLSQQLLERELRYQEDQIYQLQDELQEKCSRLDMLSGENASLRKQLGVSPGDSIGRSRGGLPRPASAPVAVPPALEIPEPSRSPSPATIPLAPPALDNIPPLPVKPSSTSEPTPLSLPAPADAAAVREPEPVAVPVAYDEPLADGRPVRLVVNLGSTACFDDNGDGVSDGVAVTVEPRDAAEKLVPAPGALTVSAYDAGNPSSLIASWSLPADQASNHFRPTTRLRGLHVPLRWQGVQPAGDHVRVVVQVTGSEGAVLEADATVAAK